MAKEDVKLTFDMNFFKKGIKKANKFISSFSKNITNTVNKALYKIPEISNSFKKESKKVEKSSEKSRSTIFETLGKLSLIKDIAGGALNIIKKVLDKIPEIGITFKAVEKIITKNLLWPLRKELIPVLQKILDWTRNNRGMFLKWGGVIVNIFKSIKIVLTAVISLIKSFVKGLTDSLKGFLKFTNKDITEVFNILVFKLTALFVLLEAKLSPVFNFIGEGLGELILIFNDLFKSLEDIGAFETFFEIMKGLTEIVGAATIKTFEIFIENLKLVISAVKGFFKGMGKVEGLNKSWQNFVDIITNLLDLIGKLVSLLSKELTPIFEVLGEVIGKFLGENLKGLLDTLSLISEAISAIVEGFIGLLDDKSMNINKTENKKVTTINDGIIKPNGDIIKTNEKDTILALKNPEKSMLGVLNKNVKEESFEKALKIILEGDIKLNITEGNAVQAGVNFAEGLKGKLRQNLLDEFTLIGER